METHLSLMPVHFNGNINKKMNGYIAVFCKVDEQLSDFSDRAEAISCFIAYV